MKSLYGLLFAIKLSLAIDLYSPGPYQVKQTSYNSLFHPGLDHHLAVWAPKSSGSFPLVFFLSGFAGLVDPKLHSEVLNHIASHGYVIVSPFLYLGLPTSQYHAEWMVGVEKWMQDNLQSSFRTNGLKATIDFSNTFLFAHSSGNHIAVNFLKLGCSNVKGLSMLSPVDGVDPYGLLEDYCITPGEKLPFEIPTLIISAGLDGQPGIANTGGLVPPCAPDELSNMRFWDALNGDAWHNNASIFGHVDFMDPGAISSVADFFHLCASNDNGVDFLYRKFVAGQSIALFKGLMGDCDMFEYLEDPGKMPTLVKAKRQGDNKCPVAQCTQI